MANNRQEIELLYESKIKNLQSAANRHNGAASAALEEVRQTRTRIDSLTNRIAELENQNAGLSNRARDLEKQLENERLRHAEDLALLERELARLRDEMAQQLQEYQDLMDIKVTNKSRCIPNLALSCVLTVYVLTQLFFDTRKVSLDLEIAAYRKLLESEEARLNITPSGELQHQRSSSQRRTPVRSGAKRKRTLLDESQEATLNDYSINSSSKGDIEVAEADPEGRFVKLYNKGSKEVSLGGWQVVRRAGDEEVAYKFHRTVKIEPGSHVTVWSSDSGKDHEPPSSLVMKGQRWFVADDMRTAVVNANGEEVAVSERLVGSRPFGGWLMNGVGVVF